MDRDEKLMNHAIALARKGEGRTSPNPMVGAVIAKNGQIVGEGWHHRAGEPHAEILAIKAAGKKAQGAEMFVNLEPCTHTGRTGPCAPKVIEAGIKRVVVGSTDPNPKVAGRGVKMLRDAGIEVKTGVLKDKSDRLNEVFFHWITTRRPFVILKAAQSLDGKIATGSGESKWITCERSRELVHRVRSRVDAVVVGVGTVIADNPSLTARTPRPPRQPKPVILDANLKTPPTMKVLKHPSGAIIFTGKNADAKKSAALQKAGATIVVTQVRDGEIVWKPMLEKLGQMEITSILIEGGSRVFGSALRSGVADKYMIFSAPMLIGGESARPTFGGMGATKIADAVRFREIIIHRVGDDFLFEGYPERKE